MPRTNYLDAAAIGQPGGLFDRLTEALSRAIDGYGRSQERRTDREHQTRMAELGAQRQVRQDDESRRERRVRDIAAGMAQPNQADPNEVAIWREREHERQGKALDRALSLAQITGEVPDTELVAPGDRPAVQQVAARTGLNRYDQQLATALARIQGGQPYQAPGGPAGFGAADGINLDQYAARVQGERKEDRELKRNATLANILGDWQRGGGMVPGQGAGRINGGTGWHRDTGTGQWFRSNTDGTTDVFDPESKTTVKVDRQGNLLDGPPPPPDPATAAASASAAAEAQAAANTERTGYPDGEYNFYNPMDTARALLLNPLKAAAQRRPSVPGQLAAQLAIDAPEAASLPSPEQVAAQQRKHELATTAAKIQDKIAQWAKVLGDPNQRQLHERARQAIAELTQYQK